MANETKTDIQTAKIVIGKELVQATLDSLQGLVADTTNPDLVQIVKDVLQTKAELALMGNKAGPEQVKEANDTLNAQINTIRNIPGLIAANRQEAFVRRFTSVLNVGAQMGLALLRARIGV